MRGEGLAIRVYLIQKHTMHIRRIDADIKLRTIGFPKRLRRLDAELLHELRYAVRLNPELNRHNPTGVRDKPLVSHTLIARQVVAHISPTAIYLFTRTMLPVRADS